MDDQLKFSAICSGPVKAAQFRFTGEGRMLAANPAGNRPFHAIDDNGVDVVEADMNYPHPTVNVLAGASSGRKASKHSRPRRSAQPPS